MNTTSEITMEKTINDTKGIEETNLPKILIVDDRPENLIALERLLKKMDVDLYKASGGNEALTLTLKHDFALALLDIQMPEMDGYELAEILRADEKTVNLPFIFISAIYTDQINIFKGYETGAFSYITKPFEPEILLNKVNFFIDKYQQEQALIKTQERLNDNIKVLEKTNGEFKAFSYSVSHDLKAPLRVINGYSEILLEDHEDQLDEEGKKILNKVITNIQKMNVLVDEMLTLSRLNEQEVEIVNIDMKSLFKSCYEEIIEGSKHDDIEFNLQSIPFAMGDKGMMGRLITNLLSNAIKYSASTDKKTIIEVGNLASEGEQHTYYVKDNGVGFNDKYKSKLFGVFQRLHNENEFQGTGIGLTIAQRVIHRNGGEIWAESKLGKGATFYFSLKKG